MRGAYLGIAAGLALAKLLLHLFTSNGYGYFRDELYYMACADHLAWGYVDHPPLSIALLAIVRKLFGTSLPALRLLPALAGALTVFLICRLAARMGGGRFATTLAGLLAIAAPIYLALNHYYSMNALDLLFWTVAFCLIARLAESKSPGLHVWILLGVVLGLGLLNKVSVLWLGFGLLAGLLLSGRHRWLWTPGPWLAGGTAAAIFLPHLLWQARHDWPTIEFIRNATSDKMVAVGAVEFMANQVLVMSPAAAPVWIAGLVWLLLAPKGRPWRLFGWIYLAVALLLIAGGGSRASYLALAYPPLLAAGACAVESLAARPRLGWLRPGVLCLITAGGLALAPFALPVLPVESFVAYGRLLGIAPGTEERKEMGRLPQQYADMMGWPEMASAVAAVHGSLPPEERAVCGVFAQNYGEAGAIDFFGRPLGLPRATSGHNNYWLWGQGDLTGECMVILGGDVEDHRRVFAQVVRAGISTCTDCMPYENNLPIFVARQLLVPVNEAWPAARHYD